ncbi:transporter [Adhaeribacter sp. BT258]|uniref:Transporter n=1 Tax=Adhaeribacter terrigena TaxID=2793070 RepID=A0ABS1C3B1_9BACT|nr:transporter [Adhaeribacter terrigena]MBK0403830.1 transporter [Adhaeribacter terrigena]
MKKLILALLALFTLETAFAQTETTPEYEEIETDRPGVGNAATVVPQGALQAEIGLQFQNDETNFYSDKEYLLPEVLIRYGLLNFLELRLRGQLTHRVLDLTGPALPENRFTDTGLNRVMLGTKVQFLKNQGARPDLALQADFELPAGDETLKADQVQPKLRLNFKNRLSQALSLNYNVGVEWEENFNTKTGENYKRFGLYTLGLGYKITETFQIFGEAFGELHQNDMQQSFDAGLAYKLKPNFQLDAYGGVGLSEEAPDYFVSAGVSYRLPK